MKKLALALAFALLSSSSVQAAFVYKDRVRDTSTTTGTGNLTVSGTPPTGYQTFSAAVANNDTFYYSVVNRDVPSEWENGLGTYNNTNVIVRTTVQSSSNAGSAVNFSAGTKDVWIGPNAATMDRIGYTLQFAAGSTAPADGATRFFGSLSSAAATGTDGLAKLIVPRTGVVVRADLIVVVTGTLGSTENTTASVRVVSTDTTLSSTVQHNAVQNAYVNSSLGIAVTAGDAIQIKLVYPTHATDPTAVFYYASVYIK